MPGVFNFRGGVIGDGDDESWRARQGPALVLLTRQHCASYANAQDAVQEGFVRFWRARERAEDATAYLFACVRSAAMDLSRGQRRRDRHEASVVPGENENVGALFVRLEQDELRQAVEAALATLPVEQRDVIVLKIWAGGALEIKPDTAASRYQYALARLQTALRQEASHG